MSGNWKPDTLSTLLATRLYLLTPRGIQMWALILLWVDSQVTLIKAYVLSPDLLQYLNKCTWRSHVDEPYY